MPLARRILGRFERGWQGVDHQGRCRGVYCQIAHPAGGANVADQVRGTDADTQETAQPSQREAPGISAGRGLPRHAIVGAYFHLADPDASKVAGRPTDDRVSSDKGAVGVRGELGFRALIIDRHL